MATAATAKSTKAASASTASKLLTKVCYNHLRKKNRGEKGRGRIEDYSIGVSFPRICTMKFKILTNGLFYRYDQICYPYLKGKKWFFVCFVLFCFGLNHTKFVFFFVVQQLLSMVGWAKYKSNYFQLVNLITN